MELAKYKACICEGAAEAAIIDILVDNDLLIFTREEMLEEQVIRCRNAKILRHAICVKILWGRFLLYGFWIHEMKSFGLVRPIKIKLMLLMSLQHQK